MSKSNAVLLVTLFAAAALIMSVVPAAAASSNCAVLLVPGSVDPSGAILATEVDLGCYPTYAEALATGSGGAIDVPALTTPASLTDTVLAADTIAIAAADVLIGTEFTGIGYGGSSKSYFASATCSTGGSVGRRGCRRLMGQPVQLREGLRRMRHEQEVREHELRRLRAHMHAELHELRNVVEPGVFTALETLRGRARR